MEKNTGSINVAAEQLSLATHGGQDGNSGGQVFIHSGNCEPNQVQIINYQRHRNTTINRIGHADYSHLIKTELFNHRQEYISANQRQIFSVCNRILICKCDDQLLWAYDLRIPECNLSESYYYEDDVEIDRMTDEWRNSFINVGRCFIYKDCLILSKAEPAIKRHENIRLHMVTHYFPKWTETKYSIISGWDFQAIIHFTDTGFLVPKEEAEPIMTELGYEHYTREWMSAPVLWCLEKEEMRCNESMLYDHFDGLYILNSNENYDYGICFKKDGLYWSYTQKELEHDVSATYMGAAALEGNVLIMHKGDNIINHEFGEFDSDSYFSAWAPWVGSKYFIPPTGKYLYYTETGNKVPLDEAAPVMVELGYGWYPSMIVGDTEAGLFWYKLPSQDHGLIQ